MEQTSQLVPRQDSTAQKSAQVQQAQPKSRLRFAIKRRRSARAVETELRHLTNLGDLDSTWRRGMVYDYFPDEEQESMLRVAKDLSDRSDLDF